MTRDDFARRLNTLQSVISNGVGYFTAWRGLMIGDEESAKALTRYRGFFLPARSALLWMALLEFAKVFDRDQRTVSLRNLLFTAKGDRAVLAPNSTEEELEEIEKQIDENEALLERLKRVRDQRIAHQDAIIAGDTSLLYGEVRKFVEQVQSMYNQLRRGHDDVYVVFDSLAKDSERHTAEVARIMREEMDRMMQRV